VLRKGKQCRERWICTLDPGLKKSQWTRQEDIEFLKKWLKHGNQWKRIADTIPDRGESQIKNHFKLILRRESLEDIQNDQAALRQAIKTRVLKRLRDSQSEDSDNDN
jgi:myb proto-oncogene protein